MAGSPARVRLMPNDRFLLVTLIGSGELASCSTAATEKPVARFKVGGAAEGVTIDTRTGFGYASAQAANKVVKFSLTDWRPVLEIATDASPDPVEMLQLRSLSMTTLPRQCLVAPPVEHHALAEPRAARCASASTTTWASKTWKGRRVAVAVGSRGIDRIGEMAATRRGMAPRARAPSPFIVPAMGSHGGATRGGPARSAGAATASPNVMRARRSMRRWTSTEVGDSALGVSVVIGAAFARAPTPSSLDEPREAAHRFRQPPLGSGLMKMSAIGLGKAEGAFRCHRGRHARARAGDPRGLGARCCRTCRGAYGIALVEDGSHQLGHASRLLRGAEFARREPELLARRAQLDAGAAASRKSTS